MVDNNYLCHKCGNIFRITADACSLSPATVECPRCGSSETRELTQWVPLGSDLSDALLEWEYECQHCRHKFKLPVPGSPAEEKNIKCPACDDMHIHRLTAAGYEPLYCG